MGEVAVFGGDKWRLRIHLTSYKVLLVIANQWNDLSSYIIEDGGEFGRHYVSTKDVGKPFDTLRLDQQHMTINYFLNANGKLDYGCIV
ncbi:MAG: hypothetical protein QXO15_01700 [Nitrososphaerota archaeon]